MTDTTLRRMELSKDVVNLGSFYYAHLNPQSENLDLETEGSAREVIGYLKDKKDVIVPGCGKPVGDIPIRALDYGNGKDISSEDKREFEEAFGDRFETVKKRG